MAWDLSQLGRLMDQRPGNPYADMTVSQAQSQAQTVRKNAFDLQKLQEDEDARQQIRDYLESLRAQEARDVTTDRIIPAVTKDYEGGMGAVPTRDQIITTDAGFGKGVLQGFGPTSPAMVELSKQNPLPPSAGMQGAGPLTAGAKTFPDNGPLVQNLGWLPEVSPLLRGGDLQPAAIPARTEIIEPERTVQDVEHIPAKPQGEIDWDILQRIMAPTNMSDVLAMRRGDQADARLAKQEKEQEEKKAKDDTLKIKSYQQRTLTNVTPDEYASKYAELERSSTPGTNLTVGLISPSETPARIANFLGGYQGAEQAKGELSPTQIEQTISREVDAVNSNNQLRTPEEKSFALENILESYQRPELTRRFQEMNGAPATPASPTTLSEAMAEPNPASWTPDRRSPEVKAYDDAEGISGITLDPVTGGLKATAIAAPSTAVSGNVVTQGANTGKPTTHLTYADALSMYGKKSASEPLSDRIESMTNQLGNRLAGVDNKERYDVVRNGMQSQYELTDDQIDAVLPKEYDQNVVDNITTGGKNKADYLKSRMALAEQRKKLQELGFNKTTADIAGKAVDKGWKVRDQFIKKETGQLLTTMIAHIDSADKSTEVGAGGIEYNPMPDRVAVVDMLAHLERGAQATEFSVVSQTGEGQLWHKFLDVSVIPDKDWPAIRRVAEHTYDLFKDKIVPAAKMKSAETAASYLANAGYKKGDPIYKETMDMVTSGVFDFTTVVDGKVVPMEFPKPKIKGKKL